jgi:hypothetical protein
MHVRQVLHCRAREISPFQDLFDRARRIAAEIAHGPRQLGGTFGASLRPIGRCEMLPIDRRPPPCHRTARIVRLQDLSDPELRRRTRLVQVINSRKRSLEGTYSTRCISICTGSRRGWQGCYKPFAEGGFMRL